jgi:hypothetical protein
MSYEVQYASIINNTSVVHHSPLSTLHSPLSILHSLDISNTGYQGMYITTAQFEHDYNEDRGFAAEDVLIWPVSCGLLLAAPGP